MSNTLLNKREDRLNKWLLTDLKLLFVLCLLYLALAILNETCPIKALFNVECPTCGSTRAICCFLSLDFRGYFNYNPLALPLAVIIYMNMHDEYFKKQLLEIGTIAVAVLTFAVYIIKLVF